MSLRLRIVLLVLLATLSPALLLAVRDIDEREAELEKAQRSLSGLAANAAADLGDKVNGTIQLLHGLSRAPDLEVADRRVCSAFLKDVLTRYPQYTGLLTINADGQLHCDSLATGRTLDLNDRDYFQRARSASDPVLEAVFGRLTNVAVLQVAYPVRDAAGNLKFVLLASLNLPAFGARFVAASSLPGIEMVIWDSKGTVMVRTPDTGATKLAGTSQSASPLYRFARAGASDKAIELPGPDGALKMWVRSALTGTAGSGLSITLGIPRETLLAEADRTLRNELEVLAVISLLAFLCALLFAEMGIRRHLARIMTAARRQGAGDQAARIGRPFPRGELGGLMETLDATAVAVQAQHAELEQKSGELRRTNRKLRMLGGVNAIIGRVRDRGELLDEVCRMVAVEGPFPAVWAGVLDRTTMVVQAVAWHGGDGRFAQAQCAATDGGGIVGICVRTRASVVAADRAGAPPPAAAAVAIDARASVALPLIVAGETAGVLVVYASAAGFFDDAERSLLDELARDVGFALELIEKSQRLDYVASFDALTGLANRALFQDRLREVLGVARATGRLVALVVIDVERFRTVNETLGRPAGDNLLQQIAARASTQVADARWLARIGYDHFAVIIPDATDRDAVALRLERLEREVFGEPFLLPAGELRVAGRFGVALFPDDGDDSETLCSNAEATAKRAKGGGRRKRFYDPQMTLIVAQNLALETALRRAVDQDALVLRYQPRVDLQTRSIDGVEAMIHWRSPDAGLLPLTRFTALLEETGLILPIGAWAMQRAVRDHREWVEAGLDAPRIAVNVSPLQLRQRDFVHDVELAIRGGTMPPGIDLEVTGSVVMDDVEANIAKLLDVRSLGLSIAIDAFGTGYSSLAYLAKLPVQTLKVDRSFIATMLDDRDTMTMVSTIVSLAHSLRLVVVADGVTTEEQAKLLHLLRCDQMQGPLVGGPLPNEELVRLLRVKPAAEASGRR